MILRAARKPGEIAAGLYDQDIRHRDASASPCVGNGRAQHKAMVLHTGVPTTAGADVFTFLFLHFSVLCQFSAGDQLTSGLSSGAAPSLSSLSSPSAPIQICREGLPGIPTPLVASAMLAAVQLTAQLPPVPQRSFLLNKNDSFG